MSKRKPSVYIAGKMRGIPRFNFPAFDRAKNKLERLGWNVVSPADIARNAGFVLPSGRNVDWNAVPEPMKLLDVIKRDLKAVLKCDAIYMLTGWSTSKGATAEYSVAVWADKVIMSESGFDDFESRVAMKTIEDRRKQ